jgi:hypothetical protein
MIRTLTLALTCSLAFAAHVFAADSYPRTAAILISGPHNYWDESYQSDMAKLQVIVINSYPRWGSGHHTTLEQTVRQIKKRNPDLKVFLYVQAESQPSPVPSLWPELGTKLDAQRWWLYQTWGGDTKVPSDMSKGDLLNITPFTNKDSSGQRFNQWMAQYLAAQIGKSTPSADGFFTDNVFWKPRRDGDWNQDGKTDNADDPAVGSWLRQGYAQYVDALRTALPGKLQIANVADWGQPQAVLTEYRGKFDGGVLEGMIGKGYSIERRKEGWQLMMAQYRKTMAAFGGPKLGIFSMSGDPTDYQAMRYGLASASLDDGYFAYNDVSKGYKGALHFDEYDAQLGAATSKPPTAAWQSGVYRRDFQNGIVLVNPKGNGPRTVKLETDFHKLKGTQDPTVNDGQIVRSVTLKDRDGLVLMRVASPR